MGDAAKILIVSGAALIVIGLLLLIAPKLPFPGNLPGDVVVKRERYTLYFPLTSGIIISIVLSLILYLFGKIR